MEEQVVSIWAATNGYLDDIPIDKCRAFERELLDHVRSRGGGIMDTISETGKLEDETIESLKKVDEDFKSSFADKVDTVETVAAEEGVPETMEAPAAEAGDAREAGSAGSQEQED